MIEISSLLARVKSEFTGAVGEMVEMGVTPTHQRRVPLEEINEQTVWDALTRNFGNIGKAGTPEGPSITADAVLRAMGYDSSSVKTRMREVYPHQYIAVNRALRGLEEQEFLVRRE